MKLRNIFKLKGNKFLVSKLILVLVWGLVLCIRAYYWLLRIRIDSDICVSALKKSSRSHIILFWHNCLFLAGAFYLKYWKPRKVYGLTSVSKDGEFVSEILRQLGVGVIRGSSSKRGGVAAQEILSKVAQDKTDIVITPDGPRGPLYKIKPTLVSIIEKSNAACLFISVEYKNAWKLKTWDQFFIPKPFSEIILRGVYYEDFESIRLRADLEKMSVEALIERDMLIRAKSWSVYNGR